MAAPIGIRLRALVKEPRGRRRGGQHPPRVRRRLIPVLTTALPIGRLTPSEWTSLR